MEASGTVGGWRPSDVSDICYGSQRRITIVGTAMNHGRHLAGIGLERFGNGKDVRLLAKASPQRSRRVCFSQCQEMCTRRRTASFYSFSDESVDSTSLHELLSITNKIQTIGPKAKYNLFSAP